MGFSFGDAVTVSGLALAAGVAVLQMTSSVRVGRGLLAIAALSFGISGSLWAMDANTHYVAMRLCIGGLTGMIAGLALTWVLLQTSVAQTPSPPIPNINGNCNQVGGQNNSATCNIQGTQPRRLTAAQSEEIANGLRGAGISVVVTRLGDPEAAGYANDLIQALSSAGIRVETLNIGMKSAYGLTIVPNGHDPKTLVDAFAGAGVTVNISSLTAATPASVAQQYSQFIGLVVGIRE